MKSLRRSLATGRLSPANSRNTVFTSRLRKAALNAGLAFLFASLAACGGGGSQQPLTTALPSGPSPGSLTMAGTSALQSVGATYQFTATVTFSDNTTRDVTSQSLWTSSANSVATITQSGGLEMAVGTGDVTISASFSAAGGTVRAFNLAARNGNSSAVDHRGAFHRAS